MGITISIIIPTYNCQSVLPRAIESVINQTFENWELLLVDGNSLDGTVDIIKQYSSDQRIRWVSEPDQGLYDAMNKGIHMAKGEWVYFMGSDDWLMKNDCLDQVFKGLNNSNIDYDIILCRVQRNGEISGIQMTSLPEILFDILFHQSIIYKKEIAEKYPFELKYSSAADQVQFLRMIADKPYQLKCNVVLANYSTGGFSSLYPDIAYSRDKIKILKSLFNQKVDSITLYRSLKNAALIQIKYDNIFKGLIWLIKGGLIWEFRRDIMYCIKHRLFRLLGFKLKTV